jgi:hypothetical protein
MKARHIVLTGILASGLGLGAANAATVTTAWENVPGGQDTCLDTGVDGARNAGFRASISNDRQTVFAWRGDDSIAIRCIGDRGLAVIFIYVVNRGDGSALLQTVRGSFRRPTKG